MDARVYTRDAAHRERLESGLLTEAEALDLADGNDLEALIALAGRLREIGRAHV